VDWYKTIVDKAIVDTLFRDDKNTTKSALLPQRHPNHDRFICYVLDAIPKGDMAPALQWHTILPLRRFGVPTS
jgi:hypothetical protein